MSVFEPPRLWQSVSANAVRLSQRWRGLLARFAGVSILSTLTYFLVALTAGLVFGVDGKATVALAYMVALPMSFFGHRSFTFRSDSHLAAQVAKFLLVHAAIIAVSTATMFLAVDYFRLPLLFGLFVSTATIMGLSFVLLSGWVFQTKA